MSFRVTLRRGLSLLMVLCLLPLTGAFALKNIDIAEGTKDLVITGLRGFNEKEALSLSELLNQYPSLETCDLTSVTIPCKTAKLLLVNCPGIRFHFMLDLYGGITLDSSLTSLDMDEIRSKNNTPLSRRLKFNDLKLLLDCMPSLTSVTLYEAPHPLELIDELREAYPRIDFYYTVRYNGMTFRPGATAYSTLKGRQDPRYTAEDLTILKTYCPDLLALDVGHNNVYDLSFLSCWPHLRRLIVVDSQTPLSDLSPLADLPDLEYLELFMQNISDLTPLAGKTRLLDLNLCHNNVSDLSPLYSCVNLERLWISFNPDLTDEEIERFKAAVPGCKVMTDDWQSTGSGWRSHPRYTVMYDSFVSGVYQPFE